MDEMKCCQKCGMLLDTKEVFGTNQDGSGNDEYCIYCYKDGNFFKNCQSCGMPLDSKEVFGTNQDGSVNEDYCIYCYKDGSFTVDCTMEEMIETSLKHMSEAGVLKAQNKTEEEAREFMRSFYPELKRWS